MFYIIGAPQSYSAPRTYISRSQATQPVPSAPPPSTYTSRIEALQPVGTTRTERRVDAQPRSVGRADTTRIQTLLGPAPPANTNRIDGIRLDTARVNNQAQANRIDAIRSDLRRTDALNATVRPLDNLNTVNRQETTHAFDSSIARRETYEFEAFQKWLSEEEQASGPVRSEGEIIQLGPHGAASRNRSALVRIFGESNTVGPWRPAIDNESRPRLQPQPRAHQADGSRHTHLCPCDECGQPLACHRRH
jgi:hypothetical protein